MMFILVSLKAHMVHVRYYAIAVVCRLSVVW